MTLNRLLVLGFIMATTLSACQGTGAVSSGSTDTPRPSQSAGGPSASSLARCLLSLDEVRALYPSASEVTAVARTDSGCEYFTGVTPGGARDGVFAEWRAGKVMDCQGSNWPGTTSDGTLACARDNVAYAYRKGITTFVETPIDPGPPPTGFESPMSRNALQLALLLLDKKVGR